MNQPSVTELQEALRRAQHAYQALGGPPPLDLASKDEGLSCEVLLGAAAAAHWYAVEAVIQDIGGPYAAYYAGVSDAYATAAEAAGC